MEKENEDKALSEVYYDLWKSCVKFSAEKKVDNQICKEYYDKFKDHSAKYDSGKNGEKHDNGKANLRLSHKTTNDNK